MKAADFSKRLRRVEGQIRGLQRMIDEDVYCVDILTQVAAATRALQGVGLGLLDAHMRHCVRDAVSSGGSDGDEKIAEAIKAVERLLKT
jgi:DNA-binding FrmR family transcriptional regulator